MGPGGRLFLADFGAHRVRWIEGLSGTPTNRLWFGTGVAGFAGDGTDTFAGLGFAVQVNSPSAITFDPAGHAWVTDRGNHAVRMVWKAASRLP
jgi:streptogramin lyase